jgi:hypothetical protein
MRQLGAAINQKVQRLIKKLRAAQEALACGKTVE